MGCISDWSEIYAGDGIIVFMVNIIEKTPKHAIKNLSIWEVYLNTCGASITRIYWKKKRVTIPMRMFIVHHLRNFTFSSLLPHIAQAIPRSTTTSTERMSAIWVNHPVMPWMLSWKLENPGLIVHLYFRVAGVQHVSWFTGVGGHIPPAPISHSAIQSQCTPGIFSVTITSVSAAFTRCIWVKRRKKIP